MARKPNYRDYEDMGKFLKDTRLYLKEADPDMYTQKAVSEYCGLSSVQFISNIERGLCAPSFEVARKLHKYYKIPRVAFYELFLKHREKILRKEFLAKNCV